MLVPFNAPLFSPAHRVMSTSARYCIISADVMTFVLIVARSRFVKMSSLAAEGVNLAREYPQSVFLQIMHTRILHIKNSSDAKLALLSILRKWPVSMATIVKNRKISQYIFKLLSQY